MLQTDFEEVYDASSFEVVHLDTDNASANALHSHWDTHNPTFPVLTGCASVLNAYGDGYIPYNVVIDTEGIVRYTDSGFSENTIHNIINQYMSIDYPAFSLVEVEAISDTNGDGRPDPGETVEAVLTIGNSGIGVDATSISVAISCDDEHVSNLTEMVEFPDMAAGDVMSCTTPFSFTMSDAFDAHWATFTFVVSATYADGTTEGEMQYVMRMGRPEMLLVDSDGAIDDNEEFMTLALDSHELAYDLLMTPNSPITADEMLRYGKIIWLGGSDEDDLTADEAAGLAAFMDNGGTLIFSSQYASDEAGNASFFNDYFGVSIADTDAGNLFVIECTPGDDFFDGDSFVIVGNSGADNSEEPDILTVNDASILGEYTQNDGGVAAVYVMRESHKAMFFGFPIEAMRIHSSVDGSISSEMFVERLELFFDAVSVEDFESKVASSYSISGVYPNPFNPETRVNINLQNRAEVNLRVYNTLGQIVSSIDAGSLDAGSHDLGVNGERWASGVYVVELNVNGAIQDTQRITLVK